MWSHGVRLHAASTTDSEWPILIMYLVIYRTITTLCRFSVYSMENIIQLQQNSIQLSFIIIIGVSMSESHTSGFNTVYVYIIITMCCMSSIISKIALRGLSYSHANALHFPRENREKLFSEEFHFV